MGTSMSCVPQHNFRFSSKSFIRRNSSRLFRKKNPQEGQEKSNSIINILCTVTPRKDMSHKDLQAIDSAKWDPPFPYDPASGWKKSSVNVKNYGRMVHSSRVRFRFLHCQDVHDCYLDLFQTHLHFVSNNTTGLTYQGTLPLKELSICKLSQTPQEFSFQVNGVSLNPIIVFCANQEEMDMWFELLREQIEANGGTAIAAETYTRVKVSQENREDLRNSISREPIYEWEGSQRESLGTITYVTKVRLQHLPCQEQGVRLLVMYPATLIILSEESDGLFYKGKLPLNMITVTTPCQDVKPNTFMIEGKLINPIVVSCRSQAEFCDWIQHFKAADVPVLSPPPPVYDIIYTPTHTREVPEFDRWSGSSQRRRGGSLSLSQSQSVRGSHHLQFPRPEDDPLSPGYTEPLRYSSSRPSSTETSQLGSRSNSVSSHPRPECDLRPLSLRYSSAQRGPPLPPSEAPAQSPIYNTPFLHGQHRANPPRMDKAPLVKSNSWSTAQTSLKFPGGAPHRHSSMCAPHPPLSPLYDEPCTPDIYALEEHSSRPAQQGWLGSQQHPHHQQTPQMLPSSFQLRTPPLGRRCRGSLVLPQDQGQDQGQRLDQRLGQSQDQGQGQRLGQGLGMEALYSQVNHRADAVSRLKLLPAPNTTVQEQRLFPSSSTTNNQQYAYSPDHLSYLEPREPDDQEMDYDNIWEYDYNTGMIQPMSGIPTHRTGLDSGARGMSSVATHQRWS
ncbi:pleckstrin homology domain-containing family N member 1 isoform X3 [Osmerus mordax]|uniref:pleckstrin homology domain-containing family N member 1 isoform X3 n=1 Tax=Osmerus mordax TaxID=8014 RepID=UPI00350F395F